MFQSTRPRGARQLCGSQKQQRLGFNPRARVGRDCLLAKADPAYPNRGICANAYRITVNIIQSKGINRIDHY